MTPWTRTLLLAAALAAPRLAPAQLLDAKVISLDAAKKMVAAAETEARRNGWTVSIAVVDAAGNLIAFERMDDASLPSALVAQGKARTAARYRRPTKSLDSALAAGRTAYLAFPDLTPVEGGVPVVVAGRAIGGIGVSGATSAQDAQMAQAGAKALTP